MIISVKSPDSPLQRQPDSPYRIPPYDFTRAGADIPGGLNLNCSEDPIPTSGLQAIHLTPIHGRDINAGEARRFLEGLGLDPELVCSDKANSEKLPSCLRSGIVDETIE